MAYDKDLVAQKLRRWEKYMQSYVLPRWEELPTIELYMEQVIALLLQYLDFLPQDERQNEVVTVSAINNYVRMKIMPAPHKKKYSRVHLAYLIMICTLKQSLNISYISKMIPMGLTEDEVRVIYNNYVDRHKKANTYFVDQVRIAAGDILDHEKPEDESRSENPVEDLLFSSAIISGFLTLMTEKIIKLQSVSEDELSSM